MVHIRVIVIILSDSSKSSDNRNELFFTGQELIETLIVYTTMYADRKSILIIDHYSPDGKYF